MWRDTTGTFVSGIPVSPHSYEKMISGEYLGEIVRLALKSLIKCGDPGSLFSGKSSTKFDEPKKFETAYASDIEKW